MPLHPSEPTPATAGGEPHVRARKSTGVIVLLAVLTILDVLAFVVISSHLVDAVDHGDEAGTGLSAFGLLLTLVCLLALGGAWGTRKWGPRLYLTAVVVDRVAVLVVMPSFFSSGRRRSWASSWPWSWVGVAERNWSP